MSGRSFKIGLPMQTSHILLSLGGPKAFCTASKDLKLIELFPRHHLYIAMFSSSFFFPIFLLRGGAGVVESNSLQFMFLFFFSRRKVGSEVAQVFNSCEDLR